MLFRSDRKSTRLNSSHTIISYAVFCLKKKQALRTQPRPRRPPQPVPPRPPPAAAAGPRDRLAVGGLLSPSVLTLLGRRAFFFQGGGERRLPRIAPETRNTD